MLELDTPTTAFLLSFSLKGFKKASESKSFETKCGLLVKSTSQRSLCVHEPFNILPTLPHKWNNVIHPITISQLNMRGGDSFDSLRNKVTLVTGEIFSSDQYLSGYFM